MDLPGCSESGLWDVRNLRNRRIPAFVVLSALTESDRNEPDDFPNSLERRFSVNRRSYKLLICPFELNTQKRHSLDKYVQNARNQGFDVKVAVIWRNYRDGTYKIDHIRSICRRVGIRPLILDIIKGYVEEARRIRRRLYPK